MNANAKEKTARSAGSLLRSYTPILYLVIFVTVAGLFVPNFASKANFLNILKQSAVPIIACVSMTFILITGNIDFSTGYIAGLVSICCGVMVKTLEFSPALTIILCLLIGAAVGACNGLLVTLAEIPSFIVTLGSSLILTGLAQFISQNTSYHSLPDNFRAFAKAQIGDLPVTIFYALIVVAIAWFVMHRSTYGRCLRSLGLNAQASRLAGIRGQAAIFSTFVISGFLTALCSILLTIRVNCAQPDMGGGNFSFEAITAAVIGGTSLMGGEVNIVCCVAGAIIIKCIESCINILNLNYYMYQAILGVVILAALVADGLKNRMK